MNKYFSAEQLAVRKEASRAVAMEIAEGSLHPLPAAQQRLIADKLVTADKQEQEQEEVKHKQKKKKSGSGSGDTASYLGSKK